MSILYFFLILFTPVGYKEQSDIGYFPRLPNTRTTASVQLVIDLTAEPRLEILKIILKA